MNPSLADNINPSTGSTEAVRPKTSASRPRVSPAPLRIGILHGRGVEDPIVAQLLNTTDWCRCEHVALQSENDFGILSRFDAMVLCDPTNSDPLADTSTLREAQDLLELLRKRQIGVLVRTNRPNRFAGIDSGVVCVQPEASYDMARGALVALAHVRPLILQIDKQYAAMQRLGRSLARGVEATNRELQLASRLQRDFLPRDSICSGSFRFTSLFRPCSWVSGDIFDIFRLDEVHWGFYLADAVGHGVAADLLTMYIKHAIRPKRILREGYEIVPPSHVLSHLNDLLAQQGLPDSQFITGWYGILNTETGVLDYSVAGHPPALLLQSADEIRELHGDGSLLGIGVGERFSDESVNLSPGDRVIIYSDGLEMTLIAHRPPMPKMPEFESGVAEMLRLPAATLVDRLRMQLDATPGSLSQADDVSMLILDYEAPRGGIYDSDPPTLPL